MVVNRYLIIGMIAVATSTGLVWKIHADQRALQQELMAMGLKEQAGAPATVMVVERFIEKKNLSEAQSDALRDLERAHRARVERGRAVGTDPGRLHAVFLQEVETLLGEELGRAFGAQGQWEEGQSPGRKN